MLFKSSNSVAVILSAVIISSATPAHAYVDPGTGSLLLQSIIGGIVGGMFIIRTYWARFRAFLSGQRGDVSTEEAAPVANAEGTHEA